MSALAVNMSNEERLKRRVRCRRMERCKNVREVVSRMREDDMPTWVLKHV